MEPFLDNALQQYGCFQRRTGVNKYFTFPVGREVYKGPYQKGSARLNAVLERSEFFKSKNVPCVVHPLRTEEKAEGTFLVFENLINDRTLEYEEELNKETFSNYKYKVVIRKGLVKMREYLEGKYDWHWMIGEKSRELLLAFLWGNYLLTGDMHLSNILVDDQKKKIYYIDYEDTTPKDDLPDNSLFYMTIHPDKKKALACHVLFPEHYKEMSKINFPGKRGKQIKDLLVKYSLNNETFKMKFSGGPFFGNLSYSGYPPDELKSAMQKFIRRGMTDRAILVAKELYKFGDVKGTIFTTMLLNRLAVCSAEDIGVANTGLVLAVLEEIEQQKQELNFSRLIPLITAMCESKKTRVQSHFYNAIVNPKSREVAIRHNAYFTDEAVDEDFEVSAWMKAPSADDEYVVGVDELLMLRYRLGNDAFEDRLNALYWYAQYCELTRDVKLTKPVERLKNPAILVFKVLEDFLPRDLYMLLRKWYFKHSETRPFVMMAIVAAITKRTDIENRDLDLDNCSDVDPEFMYEIFTPTQEERSIYLDKHTYAGASLNMTAANFITDGAHVENEDEDMIFPEFVAAYQDPDRF